MATKTQPKAQQADHLAKLQADADAAAQRLRDAVAAQAATDEAARVLRERAAHEETIKRQAATPPARITLLAKAMHAIAAEYNRLIADKVGCEVLGAMTATEPASRITDFGISAEQRVLWDESKLIATIGGSGWNVPLSTEEQTRSVGLYRSARTGKQNIKVHGWYGTGRDDVKPQTYPERADGAFAYDKIAERLLLTAQAQVAEIAAKRNGATAETLAAKLKEKLGLAGHSDVVVGGRWVRDPHNPHDKAHHIIAKPGTVLLFLNLQATPEQAEAVILAARKAGLTLR